LLGYQREAPNFAVLAWGQALLNSIKDNFLVSNGICILTNVVGLTEFPLSLFASSTHPQLMFVIELKDLPVGFKLSKPDPIVGPNNVLVVD